jgi:hypothetical protein
VRAQSGGRVWRSSLIDPQSIWSLHGCAVEGPASRSWYLGYYSSSSTVWKTGRRACSNDKDREFATRLELPQGEAESSPPSIANFKNTWSHTSITPNFFTLLCLIMQRTTCLFFFLALLLKLMFTLIFIFLYRTSLLLLSNPPLALLLVPNYFGWSESFIVLFSQLFKNPFLQIHTLCGVEWQNCLE